MNDLNQTPDSVWESIIEITSKIQKKILSAQSLKELLLMLRDNGLPIPLNEVSVVYQKYGTIKPIFLVNSGEITNKNDTRSDIEFSAELPVITEIMNNNSNKPTYLVTQKECTQKGFPDQYKSLLLIPIKISDIKNIGIFIVHSFSEENAYKHLVKPLTALSNRLAFYLYVNFITRRSNSFKAFKNKLLQKTFNEEHEIIEFLLTQLKDWFKLDKINILLIDPFNIDEYFFACKDSEVIQDYRNIKQNLEGNSVIKNFIDYLEKPNKLESTVENQSIEIKPDYNSWLSAKMSIASDQNVGYIILENNSTNTYSDWEKELVNDIASFVALFLTEFRKSLREKSILEVKNFLLADTLPNDKKLYQKAQDELNKLYGTVPLAIVRVNRTTRDLELTDTTIQDFYLEDDFKKTLSNHIETTGKLNINELPVDELKSRLTIDHPKLGKLIAAPMRSGGDELGCFIIPAPNCGPLTVRYLDDLSDMIATIMDKQGKENLRLDLILEFGNEVAKISNITKEDIIKNTKTYISKAMYSQNLYIALYDKQKNEISFPYMVKNGQPLDQPTRSLDQAKRGKTEEIIITERPILHKTKQEAQAWYNQPDHEEFLGNAFASWAGVPIITSEGVIGVIATYHPDEEYIYSQGDLFFLQMLALPVSGLFRALALENAQKQIADRERDLRRTWHLEDIKHQVGNILPNVNLILNEINNDLDKTIEQNNINKIYFVKDKIDRITDSIKSSLSSITDINNDIVESIYLPELTISTLEEQLILHDLFEIYKAPNYPNVNRKQLSINANKRDITICLNIIIENACDAIQRKKFNDNIPNYKPYIKIEILSDLNSLCIDITDNGDSIPLAIKPKIFDYGTSINDTGGGYGLWRARSILKDMNADLSIYDDTKDKKTFRIAFNRKLPLTLIVDDDPTWREVLSNALNEEGVETLLAKNYVEATDLINKTGNIEVFFLDISLDVTNSKNLDGLRLINYIHESIPSAKIVLISSFIERAASYEKKLTLKLQKNRIKDKIILIEELKKHNIFN